MTEDRWTKDRQAVLLRTRGWRAAALRMSPREWREVRSELPEHARRVVDNARAYERSERRAKRRRYHPCLWESCDLYVERDGGDYCPDHEDENAAWARLEHLLPERKNAPTGQGTGGGIGHFEF